MKTEEWDYCPRCDEHVRAYTDCKSIVGQYGKNVICQDRCEMCDYVIREKLVDKDI